MRFFPRFISKQIGRTIPGKWLFHQRTPLFMPFYHVVSNEKLPHVLNYPYRDVRQFENELDFYLKYFKPIALNEIEQTKINQNVFHLSFDDGLKECAEIIAPILLRKGIPATFFINTAFADNKSLFHKYKASLILDRLNEHFDVEALKLLKANNLEGENILAAEKHQENILDEVAGLLGVDFPEYLKKNQPYLTSAQISRLHADGFAIGAHSDNHPEFYKISEEEQIEQVKRSMQWVTERFQPEIRAFSFPFTDSGVSARVLKLIKQQNICDITFGTAGVKYDEFDFHYQRYPVEEPGNFVANLKAEFVYFELRKIVGKSVVRR